MSDNTNNNNTQEQKAAIVADEDEIVAAILTEDPTSTDTQTASTSTSTTTETSSSLSEATAHRANSSNKTSPEEDKELGTNADADEVEDELAEKIASVSLNAGNLSCAYRDFEDVPEVLAERYGSLTKRLDLSNNCLKNVAHLEKFTALEELILDNNSISKLPLPSMPNLTTLSLNNNDIEDIDSLLSTIKENAPNIKFLSLLRNLACPNELVEKEEKDYQRYRYLVIFTLPTLKFLDSRPISAKEAKEAAAKGQYMQVVRLEEDQLQEQYSRQAGKQDSQPNYSPLPQVEKPISEHKGTASRCRYVYYGRHSEGNRFIRNGDL